MSRTPSEHGGRVVDRAAVFRRRRQVAAALVVVVLGAVAGAVVLSVGGSPGGGPSVHARALAHRPAGPSTTTTTSPDGSSGTSQAPAAYDVDQEQVTLVDPTRATPARGDVPGTEGRVLVTDIWRPAGLAGPLPLIVFAHGWNSDPAVYRPLLEAWAAAGYLVAAPTFPDSADTLPGDPVSDLPDQARDLSFVVTSLLAGQAGAIGTVDPRRIAVAGHSDGGTDVALLALNPAFADPRIRAYLSLSSELPDGVDGPWGVPTAGSLLVAVGTDDDYGLAPSSTEVYRQADTTAKALLTVSGGDHLQMYVGATPVAQAVRDETIRFLQAALGGGTVTSTALGSALAWPADPAIEVQSG